MYMLAFKNQNIIYSLAIIFSDLCVNMYNVYMF